MKHEVNVSFTKYGYLKHTERYDDKASSANNKSDSPQTHKEDEIITDATSLEQDTTWKPVKEVYVFLVFFLIYTVVY